MVGVPRSSGCGLCVKRRIKCDEVRPACGNCIKYGAQCPGYDRGMKFIDGKHAVRPRKRKTELRQVLVFSESTPSPEPPTTLQERLETHVRMLTEPTDNRAQLINTMIENIKDNPQAGEMAIFYSWFNEIPPWLGKKATLDSAACALVLHLLGKANHDDKAVGLSRRLYGQSLAALQMALSHPHEWRSSETLGAAMFLCVFELFSGTIAPNSWAAHARGVAKLMQQRGPEAHRDGLDAVFFLSFRGIIIMADMFDISQDGCFLASHRWKKVLRDDGRYLVTGKHVVPEEFSTIVDDYIELLVEMPRIAKWVYLLREANRHCIPVEAQKTRVLDMYASKLRPKFMEWFSRIEAIGGRPKEIPSQDPSSIYDTVLEYPGIWGTAVFHIGYWANMLILQESINQCRRDGAFDESNREFMRNILRSVETVGQGMLGPYRLGFGLRIAFEFADVKTQMWIKMWLDRFSLIYAATASADYPETAANEYGFF